VVKIKLKLEKFQTKKKEKDYADFDFADWTLVVIAIFFSVVPQYYLITFTCLAALIVRQIVKRDIPIKKKQNVKEKEPKKESAL